MDHGADISQYSQFAAEVEFLWNPCSLVEGQDEECIETTKDGIINKISVRMNNNVKTQTVEELRQLKKSLHLNAFKYILNEIESDLSALTQARFVNSRAEADLSVAKGGVSALEPESKTSAISILNQRIRHDCEKRYNKHVEKSPEEFIQDETYRGLVRDMMETKAMAISKLRLWLEDPTQLWGEVLEMPLRTAHRTLIGFLEGGIADAGEETTQASYELCKMKNLITVSIDELNDLEEPVIIQASAEGADLGTLQLLVDAGADVNAKDKLGWTAVMKASFAGHTKTLDALSKFKNPTADVNAKNCSEETAVMLAAQKGHYDTMEKLVELKAEINVIDAKKSTALMKAAQSGHKKIVEFLLLQNNKLIEVFDEVNMSPVMMAAQGGHTELVELLQNLAEACDPPYSINLADTTGKTALFHASMGGHTDTIKVIVDRKADIHARDSIGMTPIMVAASNGKAAAVMLLHDLHCAQLDASTPNHAQDEILQPLRDVDNQGLTAVVHAASHSKTDCVMELVRIKADLTFGLHSLCKIIGKAAQKDSEMIRAVMVLVDCQADINTPSALTGKTPLEMSCNMSVREILQSKGADRWTEILTAAEQGDKNRVEHLKTKISDENIRSESALQIAAQYGHTNVVKFLIDNQAEINKADKSGKTALHASAISGNAGSIRALILAKAEVNLKDSMKKSPLAYAEDECCKYLLKLMGAENWSPLMVAAKQGTVQVQQYLKLREAILCKRLRAPTPDWFQEESRFYSSLVKLMNPWTWGCFDPDMRSLDKGKVLFSKKDQANDGCSCVLGSVILGEGIHTWELLVNNVNTMWAGIARGVDEKSGLGWEPSDSTSTFCEYILVIDEKGCMTTSSKIPVLQSIIPDVGFSSGQTIEFELDTYKKTLKMKVDKMLMAVVYEVDTREVRPYVSTYKSESVQLLSCISQVRVSAAEGYVAVDQPQEQGLQPNDSMDGSDSMFAILLGRITGEPVLNIISDHILSGSDINVKNEEECTALHIAASAGQAVVVRTLLEAKAELDGHTEGQTSCLHSAAKYGDTATLLELLHAKARVEARDALQRTALHEAVCAGKHDAVRLLITFKANVKSKDKLGRTPLEAYRQSGLFSSYSEIFGILSQMEERWTPLMVAISEGGDSNIDRVRALISEGEDVEALNSRGQSSLHIASQQGHVETIKALISGRASVEVKDQSEQTPLHLAAAAGQESAVLTLVRAKADVNARDNYQNSVLAVAREGDCQLILQIAGANGWQPLMVAVKTQNTKEYLGFRELICCMKERRTFPDWFVEDAGYYLNLDNHHMEWTWDERGAGVNLSEDNRTAASQQGDVARYTYVLGSKEFKDGVHSWEMTVDNVGSMWIGIGRAVEGTDLLGQSGLSGPNSCTLAFPSDGGDALTVGQRAVRTKKILNGFKSGDRINLELDTHKHRLKIRINEVLAFVASGFDDAGVRPLVIMDKGSAAFVSVGLSRLRHSAQSISAEDQAFALDNAKWDQLAYERLVSAAGTYIFVGPVYIPFLTLCFRNLCVESI